MPLLGVNVDHVATLRQARRIGEPDILNAARAAISGGADSITVHLREDRRHIQDPDVANLKKSLEVRLNLEMAPTDEMVRIARVVTPDSVCLVPEKRRELTTEGGLDAVKHLARLRGVCQKIKSKGISISMFVNPHEDQVRAAKEAGADMVELHTGPYANVRAQAARMEELKKLDTAAHAAMAVGLKVNAGHGLDYQNVAPVASMAGVNELNIGFSIMARAMFVGLETAVREMKQLLSGR